MTIPTRPFPPLLAAALLCTLFSAAPSGAGAAYALAKDARSPSQDICGSARSARARLHRAAAGAAGELRMPSFTGTAAGGGATGVLNGESRTPARLAEPSDTGVVFPNDQYFWNGQPNLKAIGSTDAWGVTYGAEDVVVAVISSGVDLTHPDLAAKLWRNRGEIANNGKDDDGNGYTDDVQGWNFTNQGTGPEPLDFRTGVRGTMSAGIIGAQTHNHIGVAGVSWGAAIMPLKVLRPNEEDEPTGQFQWLTDAICYAADNGARVVFIEVFFPPNVLNIEHILLLEDAVNYAHRAGAVIVAAAGDCGDGACGPAGGAGAPIYPAALTHVIGVQAVEAETLEQHTSASHGGWLDITAPGDGFQTTGFREDPRLECTHPDQLCYRPVRYNEVSRWVSNFGAAHVAGAAAVLLGLNPAMSPLQVEKLLCDKANRTVGGPYPQQPDGRQWNERFGCGLLDLEKAVDSATWVPRLRPSSAQLFTTGESPGPAMVFSSPNLNDGAWELRTTELWVRIRPDTQITGRASTAGLSVDLDALSTSVGGIQAGRAYTTELQACPIPDARGPCQLINLSVKVVPDLVRLLLPNVGNR